MEDLILTRGSYVAIVALLLLTGAGLPLPEEVVIIAAGVLSAPTVGRLEPSLAGAACLTGILLGDSLMYWFGRGLGRTALREHRWFSWALNGNREEQLERIVARHGFKVFLAARFLIGLRSPLYLAMGVLRVDFRRFLLCDVVCAALVVAVFFSASYFGGAWVNAFIHDTQRAVTILGVFVVAAVVGYRQIWKRWRRQFEIHDNFPRET
jgi:membrane protein DedA with SNARE-associated domain